VFPTPHEKSPSPRSAQFGMEVDRVADSQFTVTVDVFARRIVGNRTAETIYSSATPSAWKKNRPLPRVDPKATATTGP
jgi:hypothetical protein